MAAVLLACVALALACFSITAWLVRSHAHDGVWGWRVHPAECWVRAGSMVAIPAAALVIVAALLTGGHR